MNFVMVKENLIYPELSYQIMGAIFKVFNKLGYGYQEKYYQRGIALEFGEQAISHEREKEINLQYLNKSIGKYRLDFIIDNKIILEIKVMPYFNSLNSTQLRQVLGYLTATECKLAILIFITQKGVIYRRIINPNLK